MQGLLILIFFPDIGSVGAGAGRAASLQSHRLRDAPWMLREHPEAQHEACFPAASSPFMNPLPVPAAALSPQHLTGAGGAVFQRGRAAGRCPPGAGGHLLASSQAGPTRWAKAFSRQRLSPGARCSVRNWYHCSRQPHVSLCSQLNI